MAKYEITAPDGSKYEITAPDNASEQQIMSYARTQFAPQATKYDPTEGMSALDKGLAGAGKAFVDMYRGGKQLLGIGDQKQLQQEIDEAKQLDAPLMHTTAGTVGNVLGNVAIAAPTAMIPGANTIAGGAAIGALTGAAQPVATGEDRLSNVKEGAIFGGAVPAVVRAGKVAKAALVDPFTQAGRTRIVGNALNTAASNPVQAAANLRAATGATPGFMPTAGQAADDAGIASIERAARGIDPGGFGDVDKSQRAALVNALRSVAGTPEQRAAAVAARDEAVKPLYDSATKATVSGDDVLDQLLQRPSMQAAMTQAQKLAAERGQNFSLQAPKPVSSGLLDAAGNPLSSPETAATQYTGQGLHDLKMGLSDAIGSPMQGLQGAQRNAAVGTQEQYLNWLESKIPEYGQARQTFAEMSKPINQMDVGKELYQRFVPALADGADVPFKSRADALAQALRNGDDLTRNVTGMKSATFNGTMTPEQLSLLNGVVKDSQMKAAAETAGKGVGSDTVQKMAMSNLISEAGLPTWIGALAPLRPAAGILKTIGDVAYSKNDDTMRHLLADVLKDPAAAANAMQKAGVEPSRIAEILKLGAQSPVMALPSVANAQKE
jgi:hypothetical protein